MRYLLVIALGQHKEADLAVGIGGDLGHGVLHALENLRGTAHLAA
jgi:hypothetical protein